jgi:pimeloyl-ACP methyl ester carboxylesterase
MPVLLLRGETSEVVPVESARMLVEDLPAARWVDVPGVGHCPTLSEPEARAALREFFGVPSPAAELSEVGSGAGWHGHGVKE